MDKLLSGDMESLLSSLFLSSLQGIWLQGLNFNTQPGGGPALGVFSTVAVQGPCPLSRLNSALQSCWDEVCNLEASFLLPLGSGTKSSPGDDACGDAQASVGLWGWRGSPTLRPNLLVSP